MTFLTDDIIKNKLFDYTYHAKILSETSELIIYLISSTDNMFILRYYPKIKSAHDPERKILFSYIDAALINKIYPHIISIYDNGILENNYNTEKKKIKSDNLIAIINKITGINKFANENPSNIEFNDLHCIKKISLFIKKIIDNENKPKNWFIILDKFSQLVDHLMVDYKKKNNTVCHNNLKLENFYYDDKENIIITNFEHVGINPTFYELSNYFNNMSNYPSLEERKKYYELFSKKNDPQIMEYIDKNILLYSDISNLYWAFWAYIENYELKGKSDDKFYSDMYDYRIKKFLL